MTASEETDPDLTLAEIGSVGPTLPQNVTGWGQEQEELNPQVFAALGGILPGSESFTSVTPARSNSGIDWFSN